ncbi:hypothetical protein PFISCL1PPCAC_21453, partial [Pristionchus fissidentatus]
KKWKPENRCSKSTFPPYQFLKHAPRTEEEQGGRGKVMNDLQIFFQCVPIISRHALLTQRSIAADKHQGIDTDSEAGI